MSQNSLISSNFVLNDKQFIPLELNQVHWDSNSGDFCAKYRKDKNQPSVSRVLVYRKNRHSRLPPYLSVSESMQFSSPPIRSSDPVNKNSLQIVKKQFPRGVICLARKQTQY